ncbi:hypothetical protein [Paenibacillus sp. UMB4589-SE434]|uniref:hypothetical protein n=1 Tax=Paenibacillus sp. UMB4589-SE434 TaxID=3046314 RepID=UPI00254B1BD8|nr:hypothetical protein [Paenibacillus sp. UMB4589-SE434]MDK8182114.1 hypothetical protein [Paenibacillus sp. UMB4589-SE434]
MQPLVFDGVGTIWALGLDGSLKYIDEKINKVTMQMQFDWEKVMGGDSGYAFHYTAKDLQDKVSIEVPRYSPALAELSQGAETVSGEVSFDESEEGILNPTNGYTVTAPTKFSGTYAKDSEKVYLKDNITGALKPLTKAATTPTAEQYSVTDDGKITSNSANDDKNIIVLFKWKKDKGTRTGLSGMRKPKPFKFIHRFTLTNDKTGEPVACQLTIFKALGGGTLDVSQERKKPQVNQMSLEIMEADKTPDNPDGFAATLTFGL